MRTMNYREKIIVMIKLLYAKSETVVVTNDKTGENFRKREGRNKDLH